MNAWLWTDLFYLRVSGCGLVLLTFMTILSCLYKNVFPVIKYWIEKYSSCSIIKVAILRLPIYLARFSSSKLTQMQVWKKTFTFKCNFAPINNFKSTNFRFWSKVGSVTNLSWTGYFRIALNNRRVNLNDKNIQESSNVIGKSFFEKEKENRPKEGHSRNEKEANELWNLRDKFPIGGHSLSDGRYYPRIRISVPE